MKESWDFLAKKGKGNDKWERRLYNGGENLKCILEDGHEAVWENADRSGRSRVPDGTAGLGGRTLWGLNLIIMKF